MTHLPVPEEQSKPQPNRRAEISAKLWAVAEDHIIAEGICCEPVEERHELCKRGQAALGMAEALLVDADPVKTWNPAAPVLDAVMGLLGTDEQIVDDLNKANIALARALDAREDQLGRYLTLLHLEQQRLARVREQLDTFNRGKDLLNYSVADILDQMVYVLGDDPDVCAEGHVYLSTGCHHGGEGHDYCQSMTGIQGAKRGGKCKWCDAQCICHCHAKEPDCVASVSGDCLKEMESETACDTASGECVHGGQPATDTAETTKRASLQNLRCNHARTHWAHIPHDWEPQPGMDKVHCVGHPEGACNYACPLDPEDIND